MKPGDRNRLLGAVAARVAPTAIVRCEPRPRILLQSGERLSSQRVVVDRIRILQNIRRRLLRSEGASHKSTPDNQKFSRRLRTRARTRGVARMIGPVETACQVDFRARVVRLHTAQPRSGGGRRQLEPRWSGRLSRLSIATIRGDARNQKASWAQFELTRDTSRERQCYGIPYSFARPRAADVRRCFARTRLEIKFNGTVHASQVSVWL